MTAENDKPECFGVLTEVFPMAEDGLRHSPPRCLSCAHKTECLGTAIRRPAGVTVREEMVDRAYASKTINFIERWSRKKYLDKLKKNNTKAS